MAGGGPVGVAHHGTEEPVVPRPPLPVGEDAEQPDRPQWREPQPDAWRYRNRLQIEHPFKIGKTKFVWLVNDEFFYDSVLNDWVRNRFAVGVNHTFNKHLTLDTYVMRQNDGRTRPGDVNIIGTTWRIRL